MKILKNVPNAQFRQGDVLIRRVAKAINTKELKQVKADPARGTVLAYGEASGHAHAFSPETATMFKLPEKQATPVFNEILEASFGALQEHDEHESCLVPEGQYEIRHQREYEPTAPRLVAD